MRKIEFTPSTSIQDKKPDNKTKSLTPISQEENLEILNSKFQEKLFYSIKEVSLLLNTSYDFVAEKIRKEKIHSTKFGDRPMVHAKELARLMTEGI